MAKTLFLSSSGAFGFMQAPTLYPPRDSGFSTVSLAFSGDKGKLRELKPFTCDHRALGLEARISEAGYQLLRSTGQPTPPTFLVLNIFYRSTASLLWYGKKSYEESWKE